MFAVKATAGVGYEVYPAAVGGACLFVVRTDKIGLLLGEAPRAGGRLVLEIALGEADLIAVCIDGKQPIEGALGSEEAADAHGESQ